MKIDGDSFNQRIMAGAREVIDEYKLIDPNELVVVALSGGKDSVLTLHILADLMNELEFDLVAVSIDEGIGGYRSEGVEAARLNCESLGIELVEGSLKGEFGFDLDDLQGMYQSSCIPCGVFRRQLLNKISHQLGADKLATGHNLDDEIQSFLMSLAKAELRRFYKFGPKLDRIHPDMVPRIKPLWKIHEKDVGIWAVLNNVEVHFAECPYSETSLRSKIKGHLNQLEEKRPGTKLSMLESFSKSFKFEKKDVKLGVCSLCGEPSSLNVCMACEMISEINDHIK
jgi:uncharacterized protein (TIGR00269 family)